MFNLTKFFWTETYKDDIFRSDLVDGSGIFPLHFDALGHLYPDVAELSRVSRFDPNFIYTPKRNGGSRKSFKATAADVLRAPGSYALIPSGQHPTRMTTSSLALIFSNPTNKSILKKYIASSDSASEEIIRLQKASEVFTKQIGPTLNSSTIEEKLLFDQQWAQSQYHQVASNLCKKIKQDSIDKVFFFFAGYNMPYAMQAIQAEKFRDSLIAIDPESNYLVVPGFWPSGGTNKSIKKWTTNHGLSAGFNWFYFLNKGYYVGYGFRAFYSYFDDCPCYNQAEYYAFAHSGGNSILATAMGDFGSIKSNEKGTDITGLTAFDHGNNGASYQGVEEGSQTKKDEKIIKKYRNKYDDWKRLSALYPRIPTSVNIFHSAPAISSNYTFMIENEPVKPNIFGSLNSRDPLLTKPFAGWLLIPKRNRPWKFGATTLGSVGYVAKGASTRVPYKHTDDLNQKSHNVLVYLDNCAYNNLFREFLELSPIKCP